MPKLNSAIVSTAVFLIVSAPTTSAVASNLIVDGKSATDLLALAGNYIPTTYLDAKGIFTAILVAIGCVEIMHFMFKKDIRIKMLKVFHQQSAHLLMQSYHYLFV